MKTSNEPLRVLHVVGAMNIGGAESRIMDIYRAVDRSKIQFDFLEATDRPAYFDEEIGSLGGHIFYVTPGSGRQRQRRLGEVCALLERNSYATVHMHEGALSYGALKMIDIFTTKGVGRVIIHSRSAGVANTTARIKHYIFRSILMCKTIDCFAVSQKAAVWMFGKKAVRDGKVTVIKNAINVDRFRYDEQTRQKFRDELNLQDAFVIGHVGRFVAEKNHAFLLHVFACVQKQRTDARLLLVGDGSLMQQSRALAKELGVIEHVHFAGQRGDVEKLYQAMDAYCFPSISEGLPGTVLEAQAAGLACFLSDAITDEVKVLPQTWYLSLRNSVEEWAQAIIDAPQVSRYAAAQAICAVGYDICSIAKEWEAIYFYCR